METVTVGAWENKEVAVYKLMRSNQTKEEPAHSSSIMNASTPQYTNVK